MVKIVFSLSIIAAGALVKSIECSSILKFWNRALRQTFYEQEVEDINAVHKIDNHLVRRLIVMPLTEDFKPNQADLMHDKVQYGDKCSLPTSIGRFIFEKRFDVPWIFELKPVRKAPNDQSLIIKQTEKFNVTTLDKVYISPLDFRSPENYIFLPQWMMTSLNLKSNDLVDISFVRIKLAELVVFQPLSLEWDALIARSGDPKVLLEHEINKYSSLTAGSIIKIAIRGTEYPLLVKDTIAEGGVSVDGNCVPSRIPSVLCDHPILTGVRVQDSDIRTDIDRSILNELLQKQEEAKEDDAKPTAAI